MRSDFSVRFTAMAPTALILSIAVSCLVLTATAETAHADTAKINVAVMYFDHNTKVEELAFLRKGLAQMLAVDLAKTPGVTVVERLRLEEILAELKLNQSKRIDRKTAVKVGKLLGARYLVMGSYNDFRGDILNVVVKVVDVQTGATSGLHDHRKVEEFWNQEQYLASEISTILRANIVALKAEQQRDRKARSERRDARRVAKARAARTKASKTKASKTRPTATTSSKPARTKTNPTSRRVHAVGGSTTTTPAATPETLDARTAARYGKALDAMDRGDKSSARKELKAVIEKSPSFNLASVDLASLAR